MDEEVIIMAYGFWSKTEYDLSFVRENIEMVIYTAVCFFIPFLLGHPQLFVGVVVNASLVMAAMNLKGYKLLPVIIAPSLGVLSRGLIFGPFTVFLLYMIPFIWVGNMILVMAFKWLRLKHNMNRWVVLAIGGGVKAAFLFTIAYILVSLGVLPALFTTVMGIIQLTTAILGGVAALSVQAVKKAF